MHHALFTCLLLLSCHIGAFADTLLNDPPELGLGIPEAQPTFQAPSLINMTAIPSSVVNGSVNVITGDYCEINEDALISGPDPFSLGHAYFSSSLEDGTLGSGWNFFHHHLLQVFQPHKIHYVKRSVEAHPLLDFPYSIDEELIEEESDEEAESLTPRNVDQARDNNHKGQNATRRRRPSAPYTRYEPVYAFLFEPFGGRLTFNAQFDDKKQKLSPFTIVAKNTGFTNVSGNIISAHNNIKNSSIKWHKNGDYWTSIAPDGTRRTYKRQWKKKDMIHDHPRHATYYRDYHLTKERKPSGNMCIYDYNDKYEITRIRTYNKSQSKLQNWIKFDQKSANSFMQHPSLHVTSSDGLEQVYYFNHLSGSKKDGVYAVSGIKRKGFPYVRYLYSDKSSNHKKRVLRKSSDDGYFLDTRYYGLKNNKIGDKEIHFATDKQKKFNRNRVRYQASPCGPHGKKITTHAYYYYRDGNGAGHTKVIDALGQATRYYWDSHKRLIKVKRQDKSFETFVWGRGKNVGRLMVRTLFDESGKARISKEFVYDKVGNVLEEHVYGRVRENHGDINFDDEGYPKNCSCDHLKTSFTYSNDHLHLKESECDPDGNYTIYRYDEGTNLIRSKLSCDKDKVKKREYFIYDNNALCVQHIVDDGSSHNRDNMTDVTERHITYYKRRLERPHFGEPLEIAEYYLDMKSGKEVLLSKTLHTYSKMGFLIKKELFDANKESVATYEYDHDEIGRVIYSKNPLGEEEYFTYDKAGRLEKKQGPRPDVTKYFEYDLMGRCIKESEVQKGGPTLTVRYEYDALGRKVASTDPQGNTTHFEYDCLNRLTKIRLKSSIKTFRYEKLGTLVRQVDENGYETMTVYNMLGNVLEEYFPDGTTHFCYYDKKGNLVKDVSTNEVQTRYRYDAFSRMTTCTMEKDDKVLSRKKMKYNAFHLIKETQPAKETVRYCYDGAGRKCCMVIQGKKRDRCRKTTYLYDSLSRVSAERITCGKDEYIAHSYSYDALNRKVRESLTDHTQKTHTVKRFGYDVEGNCQEVIEIINGKPSSTQTTYYPHGLPKTVTDAEGKTTHYFYDFFHETKNRDVVVQKSIVDPSGVKTEIVYDIYGNVTDTLRFDPFGVLLSKQKLKYDHAQNLIEICDYQVIDGLIQSKIITGMKYGPNNRQESITEAKHTPEEKVTHFYYNKFGQKSRTVFSDRNAINLIYDDKGRVAQSSSEDNSFSYSYSYDNSDRIQEVVNNIHKRKTVREYNSIGDLVSETLETGLKIDYEYDLSGHVSELTLPDGSSIAYGYSPAFLHTISRFDVHGRKQYEHIVSDRDLSGRVLKTTLPLNAGTLNTQHDICGRTVQLQHKHFSQKVPQNGFDTRGNLVHLETKDALGTVSSHFSYDFLNQLTKETGNASHEYAYDSLYNRQSVDKNSYKINALHSVLSDGERKFSYDKRANRTEMQDQTGKTLYRYDGLDRLIEITKPGIERIAYSYDAFDRRVEKTVYSFNSYGWTKKHHEKYLYVGSNEIGAVNDRNEIFQLRVLGEGLGAEIGAAVAIELNKKVFVPLHDHRGNVVALVEAITGTMAATYRYDAFGLEELTSSIDNPWRFASKRTDSETGFVYFGRRFYDPSLGKWLTHDPLGLKAGPNLYAYVQNCPLTHFDLYGLYAETEHDRPKWRPYLNTNPQVQAANHRVINQQYREKGYLTAHTSLFKSTIKDYTSIPLIDRPAYPGATLLYLPGVNTSNEKAIAQAMYISDLLGGYQVHMIQNNTYTLPIDVTKAVGESILNFQSEACTDLIHEICNSHATHDGKFRTFIIPYSGGAIITYNALEKCDLDQRQSTVVVTICPGKLLPNGLAGKSTNVVNKNPFRDFVPYLNSFLPTLLETDKNISIDKVTSHKDAPLFDHDITSPTYAQSIREHFEDFKQSMEAP